MFYLIGVKGTGLPNMPIFMFRCPNTRQRVQALWLAEEATEEAEAYLPFQCGACRQFHRINPLNGRMLRSDPRTED